MGDARGFAVYDDAAARSPSVDPAEVTVRVATADDVEQLTALAAAEQRRAPGEGPVDPPPPDRLRERVAAFLEQEDRRVTVAETRTGLVAYGRVGWYEPEPDAAADAAPAGWYLTGLSVEPVWRRRGIARALTEERTDWIASRAVEAWYFANARNRVSLALHASLGFVEVTRNSSFPGVTFRGGVGVLSRIDLGDRR